MPAASLVSYHTSRVVVLWPREMFEACGAGWWNSQSAVDRLSPHSRPVAGRSRNGFSKNTPVLCLDMQLVSGAVCLPNLWYVPHNKGDPQALQ